MTNKAKSKLAVITGGTKGIGRATVELFLDKGYEVVTCSRNSTDLEKLKSTFSEFPKDQLTTFQIDMSKKSEVMQFAAEVNKLDKPVDVLVNNAGFFEPGLLHEESEGALEKVIETNLYSAYYLTRGLIKKMISEKKGDIFNLCSIASLQAYPNGGSYGISKFALLGFTKGLREEMKEYGIRVTAILPGATLTPSWEGVDLPESRFIKATDVAHSIWAAHVMSPFSVIEEILIRPQLGDI